MPLGNKIKEFREERGESLMDVARAVGMDRAHLHRVERGMGGCADETKVALAAHFGVFVTDLFFQPSVDTAATQR